MGHDGQRGHSGVATIELRQDVAKGVYFTGNADLVENGLHYGRHSALVICDRRLRSQES